MIPSPLALLLSLLSLSYLVHALPEVKVGNTIISGLSLPNFEQDFFGGIPFAEPPTGDLRFAPPVVKLDPGVPSLNATQFGVACAQGLGFGENASSIDSLPMSEDCLTLNVLRPSDQNTTEGGLVPVLVWVYGGGFSNGAALLYNGSAIVAQSVQRGSPVIYVNVNYRLGPFGFPQGAEAEAQGALNLGNKDILAALTWVQNNIAAFGGDKDRVTVFGESAGAILLAELLLDPQFNLARAAILESGSAASNGLFNTSSHELVWQTLVSAVPECEGASSNATFGCLRNASTETIINASNHVFSTIPSEFPFAPLIDGPGGIIPDLPSKLFKKGQFSRIPFISGTNLDEGTLFIPTTFNSTEQLREWVISNTSSPVVTMSGPDPVADEILKLYPDIPALGSPYGTGNETFGLSPQFKRVSSVLGDLAFVSVRRELVETASEHGVRAFAYLFADPQTAGEPFLGVSHGSEILYVYGAPQNGPDSVVLSSTMIDYWVSFATTLDPNDGLGNASRPLWTQYTTSSKDVMQLSSVNLTMIPDTFRDKQISFLNENAKNLSH
ncbi:esterase 1 [Fomitiporia mediterranea MF3/22]|uniref:esterase 1 n=1 Tax=Fomitiporia mediterranea (strain MF3/22) TaxID=694068 RepID=UPI0004407D4F|nr:esterase 1 [Fomitiporia mediterranea MF3/22]EJD02497.1 esterase 1 [Fomitiporia mediterranea MF3/22]